MVARSLPSVSDKKGTGKAITVKDDRWKHCHIKTTMLLPNCLAKQKAKERGCSEAIFVREGKVIEGGSSNVFVVKNGKLYTTPEHAGMLSGITRRKILYLAKREGIPVKEIFFDPNFLDQADEVFLTSTGVEIDPVVKVDKWKIGKGDIGRYTGILQSRFKDLIGKYCK
jgi:D-alanine transaminase